jgi:phosphoribosylformimino-5-aminoimidazole carboxamide ribonucleotide (ProFAR) isomerase
VARAEAVLAAGAAAVIVGSSFFRAGRPDLEFARALADAVGPGRVIAAVDSLGGRVVVRGWREATPLAAADAMAVLEPYCGGFLYTHVDTEGLMGGIDLDAVRTVRAATTRGLAVAGGITTKEEIDMLDALGIDAVVGMAIYTGRLVITPPAGAPTDRPTDPETDGRIG